MSDPSEESGTPDDRSPLEEDETWAVKEAHAAYKALQALNCSTMVGSVPAATVPDILGQLKGLTWMLPQAFMQLGAGLTRSLHQPDTCRDGGRSPADYVFEALSLLTTAVDVAADLSQLLEAAEDVIAHAGAPQATTQTDADPTKDEAR